eukprot:gnl/TRDRNA2_/TRDRNA2_159018_c0_seq1.p1 gnl/TRDRNA2_/TRDRNA2_159018_c0~~gnl/TRDRNA2_/TRDRNA2_159018_c0_seq1.p1  ORF type:complete len:442 (-),score=56.79 gnl/TRDRNA2_/TRDRNA2_159018_c0_seq1:25-1350(-)
MLINPPMADTVASSATMANEAVPAAHSPNAGSMPDKVIEPDQLLCPITHMMLRDPAFVPESGNTYEREAIVRYWASSPQPKDPLTNSTLSAVTLHSNWGVRREVQRFLDAHPGYTPQGWPDRCPPPPPKVRSASSGAGCQRPYLWVALAIGVAAVVATAAIGVLLQPSDSEAPWEAAATDAIAGSQLPKVPRGSQLQVALVSTPDGARRLKVRHPRRGITMDAVSQACFAVMWLGIISVWTLGVVQGGPPVSFGLFSLPFWGVGAMLLVNVGQSVLASERMEVDGQNFIISTEIFGGHALSTSRGLVDDLLGPPEVECDEGASCQLLFEEDSSPDRVFGATVRLKRDEARWLQRQLSEHLVKYAQDGHRRFRLTDSDDRSDGADVLGSHTSDRKRRDEGHGRRGSGGGRPRRSGQGGGVHFGFAGFGGFAAFGPGFGMVIR